MRARGRENTSRRIEKIGNSAARVDEDEIGGLSQDPDE